MTKRETIDIHELIELLHVPVVEHRLHLKVEELKSSEYENKIILYKQRVATYKRILFESKVKTSNENEKSTQPYWFELTKYRDDEWKVTRMEPDPPPFCDILEIIPDDIIKLVDCSLTNPDKVESMRNIPSSIFQKHYDLEFVRCSDNHAVGTICETPVCAEKRYQDKAYIENEKLDFALRLFFSYMQKFPLIRDYFLNEFFSKIKLMYEEGNEDFILS